MTRVMLVEDNEGLRGLMRLLLEMEGFEVVTGPVHPEEVLAALREQRPQVLIMDVHLEGREASGFDLVQAIRRDEALRTIGILLISGMDYRLEAVRSGADAFLPKPFMGDELIRVTRRLAEGSLPCA